MSYIIKALTDKEALYRLQAYNSLLARKRMLDGVGVGIEVRDKVYACKRIVNMAFDLKCQGLAAFRQWVKYLKEQDKKKDQTCRRIMYNELRFMGQALRMLKSHMREKIDNERLMAMKKRGIFNRIVDANTRLKGMGYNKLVESWKAGRAQMRKKLQFVIQS